MRASLVIPLAFVLAACGGGPTPDNAPLPGTMHMPARIETSTGAYQVVWDPEASVASVEVPMSADGVWEILPEIYGELNIDPGSVDPHERLFGNRVVHARRQLGGVRLSRYVDCGAQLGIANADVHEVTLSVMSQVMPDSGSFSRIRTQVDAYAHADGESGPAVHCSSKGELEQRISRMIVDRVRRGATAGHQ